MLHRISSMKPESELDSHIDHFAAQVALTFEPQLFDKESAQSKAIEILEVEGKRLKSAFEFGIVTSDKNWSTIIKSIALKEDEAMLVSSSRHIITITRKNGEYVVYDPEYNEGFKTFPTEQSLIRELHYNVFHEAGKFGLVTASLGMGRSLSPITEGLGKKTALGMEVKVIRHPSDERIPREFPDINELYRTYLLPNQTASIGGFDEIDNLRFAINFDNNEVLQQLFEKGFKDKAPFGSAIKAIILNSTNVLGHLLEKIPKKDDGKLISLFEIALRFGHKRAFDKLLEDPRCRAYFDSQPLEKNADRFFYNAAIGGNVELLKQLIEICKKEPSSFSDTKIVEKILRRHHSFHGERDTILAAIYGTTRNTLPIPDRSVDFPIRDRSIDCVELLLDMVGSELDEARLVSYLHAAVKTNQPCMVDLFINKIKTTDTISEENKQKIFQTYTMNINSVERTDLSILRKLKECGVQFSKNAEYIFDKKESRAVGYLLPIGIMLNKFTDFVKETLLQQSEVKTSIKKYQGFKKTYTEVKETLAQNPGNDATVEQADETTPLIQKS